MYFPLQDHRKSYPFPPMVLVFSTSFSRFSVCYLTHRLQLYIRDQVGNITSDPYSGDWPVGKNRPAAAPIVAQQCSGWSHSQNGSQKQKRRVCQQRRHQMMTTTLPHGTRLRAGVRPGAGPLCISAAEHRFDARPS